MAHSPYILPIEDQIIAEIVEDDSNGKLIGFMQLILADKELLNAAAARSYRHQLGFLKLVLMSKKNGRCLRLHFWDRPSTVIEDIHSHCADFTSRVVFGTIEESSFELTSGDSYARFRYRFDTTAGSSVAIKEGITGVRLRECRNIFRAGMYTKSANELHSVGNVEQGTVTVSAWEERNREAIVLKHIDAHAEDCFAISGMPPAEMLATLKNIMERLNCR